MHSQINNNEKWTPHITVAAVIENADKFLLVTDDTRFGLKLNQPAGHVDEDESIIDAIKREVKEETGLDFEPSHIVGIYFYKLPSQQTYLRICFTGNVTGDIINPHPIPGDDGVVAANWLDLITIKQRESEHRTPFVMRCLDDYLAKKRFPLSIINEYVDLSEISE